MLALLRLCAKISGRFYQRLHKVHVQYTVPYIVFARYVRVCVDLFCQDLCWIPSVECWYTVPN